MSDIRTEALEQLGEPGEIARELAEFGEAASAFSPDEPWLLERYDGKWIAADKDGVRADADTIEHLLQEIDRQGLHRSGLMIRFIDRNKRTLIL
jgi:hypothetical protein